MEGLPQPALEILKRLSHEVWEKYDDTYGYRNEKQAYNASVRTDVPDNCWFFWGQFDFNNQAELVRLVAAEPDDPTVTLLREWLAAQQTRRAA